MSTAPAPAPLATGTTLHLILAFGVLGLVVSWAVFIAWGFDAGFTPSAFVKFWQLAFTEAGISGLTWDLIASGLILSALTVHRRHVIGGGGVALVLSLTWTLGVCVGLAVLFAADARALRGAQGAQVR